MKRLSAAIAVAAIVLVTAVQPAAAELKRRPLFFSADSAAIPAGVCYGPHRAGQRPGGPHPSETQLLEDLRIIAGHWQMLRIYGADGPAEPILKLIRKHRLPIKVMLGAWIEPERREGKRLEDHVRQNRAQVEAAIRLARAYEDVVFAVNVGNESQVFWSGHRTAPAVLIGYLREVRGAIRQPVTTADDYNFWNRPESEAVAAEVDFLLLHAYAMWNRQTLADAVPWTRRTVESIAEAHPDLTIVLGETGWATVHNPDASGDEATQIIAPAGEDEQRRFYQAFTAYARQARLPYFYFEAFDEPWKGGADPRGVEKHWGLYNEDRTPKRALK